MTPILLSLMCAVGFFGCLLLTTDDRLALSRTIFACLFVTVIACLAIPSPGGEVNGWDTPIIAQGQYDDGRVAEIIVERSSETSLRRTTFIDRSLILERPLPTLTIGLWTILILTLMGLVFTGFKPQRARGPRFLIGSATYGLVCTLLILWWAHGLPESESGEMGIRDYLATFTETDDVVSFTVPKDGWAYTILGGFPIFGLYLMMVISIMAILRGRFGCLPLEGVQPVWVLMSLVCVVYQVSSTGGLPWRAQDGALFLTSLILVSAYYYSEEKPASMPMSAVAVFPVLLAYTL